MPDRYISENPFYYRGNLNSGQIPEPFWFLRQALEHDTDFSNIALFNDNLETTHEQVMELIRSAIGLVDSELKQTLRDWLDDRAT